MNYDFGFEVRTTLRLGYVEDILRRGRILLPVPSRSTLIGWIEEGRIEGKQLSCGWVVYEDSFKAWVRKLQPEAKAAA